MPTWAITLKYTILIILLFVTVYFRLISPRFHKILKWIFFIFCLLLVLFIVIWYCLGLNLWLYPKKYNIHPWKRIQLPKGLTIVDTGIPRDELLDITGENARILIYMPGINPPHEILFPSVTKHDMVRELHKEGFRVFMVEHRFSWWDNNENMRVEDLQLTWNYLVDRFPDHEIIIIGNSYGATVTVKWTLRQIWVTGKHPQLQGIVLLNMTVCFKDALSKFLLPKWMARKIKQSTLEDISISNLDKDEVMLKTCSEDINSLLPMNVIAGHVPIVLVYVPTVDPFVDENIWSAWLEEGYKSYAPINGIDAIQGIKLKNRKHLDGIEAHCKTQYEDRQDWFPVLHTLFTDSRRLLRLAADM
jgi:pimeloyl-ACP methyl ester carboxylesterase